MVVFFTIVFLFVCLVELLFLELRRIYLFWIEIFGFFCVFGLGLIFGAGI